jgi:hypothetical protein
MRLVAEAGSPGDADAAPGRDEPRPHLRPAPEQPGTVQFGQCPGEGHEVFVT